MIEICYKDLQTLIESPKPDEDGLSLMKSNETVDASPVKEIRPDLKFDFNQPPILQYESKEEDKNYIYVNLGNQSEIICSFVEGEDKKEFRGLKKYLT